jgi:exopolysaccharide biosynthesis WecB/TagA/CpsF family protein
MVCEAAARESLPVYFYGSRQDVIEALVCRIRTRFPELRVAGYEASAFRTLTSTERLALIARIRASGAAITLVGLGCPRQEVWAYEYRDLLGLPVLAVGAAFDFHAGVLRQAPAALQRLGLEWSYRLLLEPRRLWRRYAYLNPLYLAHLLLQATGIRRYSPEDARPPRTELNYG